MSQIASQEEEVFVMKNGVRYPLCVNRQVKHDF